ncbi:MAG: hypothetical protein JJE47_10825 [Acidimicrobiia bacterium]|nr:hypothetical protein [Acidimicrobiia bacterium]
MRYVPVLLGVVVGLYLLHRLATYAEQRGWVYYRSKPPHGAGSIGVMRVMSLFDPTIEHVIEEVVSDRMVIDETGEPPGEEE